LFLKNELKKEEDLVANLAEKVKAMSCTNHDTYTRRERQLETLNNAQN